MAQPVKPSVHYLIESAAAILARNETQAVEKLKEVPALASQVYERLWEVMQKPPNDPYFGEKAFADPNFDIRKKIQALEHVLAKTPSPKEPPVQVPRGTVEIKTQGYDLGFDPSYDITGSYQLPSSEGSTIKKIIIYVIFYFKSWLSLSQQERNYRSSILKCANFERSLSLACEKSFVKGPLKRQDVADAEWKFIYSMNRLFQGKIRFEMLQPIHLMKNDSPESLADIPSWPYARLDSRLYTKFGVDTIEHHYVPPYIFTHATQSSVKDLKLAFRDFRQALRQVVSEWKYAFSLNACECRLGPEIFKLQSAWKNYIDSHELLQEADRIYKTNPSSPVIGYDAPLTNGDAIFWYRQNHKYSEDLGTKTEQFLQKCLERVDNTSNFWE